MNQCFMSVDLTSVINFDAYREERKKLIALYEMADNLKKKAVEYAMNGQENRTLILEARRLQKEADRKALALFDKVKEKAFNHIIAA
jgi:hypothetical protein